MVEQEGPHLALTSVSDQWVAPPSPVPRGHPAGMRVGFG